MTEAERQAIKAYIDTIGNIDNEIERINAVESLISLEPKQGVDVRRLIDALHAKMIDDYFISSYQLNQIITIIETLTN